MQLALLPDDRAPTLEEVHRRLRARFGRPGPWLRLDPMSQLVLGSIGGRTYEAVTLAAFEALISRFDRWDRVRDAPVADVRATIRGVTFAEAKAARLQATLRLIASARGALTLEFLRCWAVRDALEWLERLPGVGRKASAATLNFSTLRMKALVIDTHHLRVLRRLGLVGSRAGLIDVYDRVMPWLPASWTADDLDDHHQLMKRLGQEICGHSEPNCHDCPVNDLCPSGGAATGGRPPKLRVEA